MCAVVLGGGQGGKDGLFLAEGGDEYGARTRVTVVEALPDFFRDAVDECRELFRCLPISC